MKSDFFPYSHGARDEKKIAGHCPSPQKLKAQLLKVNAPDFRRAGIIAKILDFTADQLQKYVASSSSKNECVLRLDSLENS